MQTRLRLMQIELIAAGTRSPSWVSDGYKEYEKRLPREWQLILSEIPVAHRGKSQSVAKLKEEEGKKMLERLKTGGVVIAMDSRGGDWTTEKLAQQFTSWLQTASQVQLMVGGPDGLSQACLQRADFTWSLSRLTFPHFMVRLLLAEQIYRAWSVINHHPYHK
ncbi:MAG: 23S rRNA (pseudouridine1915-N3)-methyltransferase [Candidatus Azotimanducaceae bacterium]|jgi:23S rRNA (pseudouridine1915-N3)-methyltransferase